MSCTHRKGYAQIFLGSAEHRYLATHGLHSPQRVDAMSEEEWTDRDRSPEHRRTMRYWLGRTLRDQRKAKGLALKDVVVTLRNYGHAVSEAKLSRLESGAREEKPGEGWPRGQLDEIVAAYAQVCGIEDGRDLWSAALATWKQAGGAPVIGELTPYLRAELAGLEARQRSTRHVDGSSEATTSKAPRRKAR